MKLGVLFSGGKDSVYATYLAKKEGYEISCLISLFSENSGSYMFHTPNIEKVQVQADAMNLPLIVSSTKGEKEKELEDLKMVLTSAKEKYGIEGVVTGAIKSVYQATRVQKICDELNIDCFNPLWQKDEEEYLDELINEEFKIIVVGVFAYPLNESWVLREIDSDFVKEIKELNQKYKIHVAGEGGEFETYVLGCSLFDHELKIVNKKIIREGENSVRAEVEVN